jgi:hypothetical protein
MKTKYTVMASAILMGCTFAVSATTFTPIPVPAPYDSGPLDASSAPGLFVPEKAAYVALEGALQEAEGRIYSSTCGNASGTWQINVVADQDGNGFVDVNSFGGDNQFSLTVEPGRKIGPPVGSSWHVFSAPGSNNRLAGVPLPSYNGTAYYNASGQMMTLGSKFDVGAVTGHNDNLTGGVIKDFFKRTPDPRKCSVSLRDRTYCGDPASPVIYDWGLQFVSKNYVPQDKWWQRSASRRSNGEFAYTKFVKDRLYAGKHASSKVDTGMCNITILMDGTQGAGQNDQGSFDQTGTLTISRTKPTMF